MNPRVAVSVLSDERKAEVQEQIGYRFQNVRLLDTAFIRPDGLASSTKVADPDAAWTTTRV